MSISAIVRGNSFNELKEFLKAHSPKKSQFISSSGFSPFSRDIPVRAPAGNITSHESGHIGELADFLFCLEVARYVEVDKNNILDSLTWRAESIFNGCIRIMKNSEKHVSVFEDALSNCLAYAKGKDVDLHKLVNYANLMCKTENYLHYTERNSRENYLDYFLVPCPEHIVRSVAELIDIFRDSFLNSGIVQKDSRVVCHPWFEPWSGQVGGGVADIFIDGVIYDFKSTKKLGFSWEDVGQVFGYYVLHRLCMKFSKEDYLSDALSIKDVSAIAVYYSRLGDIETCNLLENGVILSDDELECVSKLICDHNSHLFDEKLEELLEDIAVRIILREKRIREKHNYNTVYTPETINYDIGDEVYLPLRGRGVVCQFRLVDGCWLAVIKLKSGEILGADINKTILLNWNSQELSEWRRIHNRLYKTAWLDKDAVSEFKRRLKELQAIQ